MIESLDLGTIVLLCIAAGAAGWVDAVTGGGGLIQLPSLLIAMPNGPPADALGTNKLSSIIGTSAAAATYLRNTRIDLRTALPMAVAAFIGAGLGALLASHIPAASFRPIILVMLIGVWLWTWLKPAMGTVEQLRWEGQRRHYGVAVIAGLGIGFYDGLIGPGTGSFLLIVLVAGLGLSFLKASATAKIVNVGTNIAALIIFGFTGSVLWLLGLLMGACNLVGAVLGARTAIAKGSEFVRRVFLVVVALLILRLAWDVLAGS
ncbi:unannotated protein [freshwater metagenome]|uniref:Unannotated protein n=1 Tax=freshwater metagenome TaxID=449393 RepID=A0A6J7MKQ0_9ZZZZ|nr:TSUP family transporter [Actinomycetota bacterium]